jgi:hypothetical protein
VNILLLTLAVLGGITGLELLYKLLQLSISAGKRRRRTRQAVKKDFYYRRIETPCRICVEGHSYIASRYAEVKVLKDGLKEIRVGFGPASAVDFEIRLARSSDNSFVLRRVHQVPPDVGDWDEYTIDLGKEYGRSSQLWYELSIVAKAREGSEIPPYWWWQNERRVDELVQRVVFSDGLPEKVVFRPIGADLDKDLEIALKVDPVSFECSHTEHDLVPMRKYSISWERKVGGGEIKTPGSLGESPVRNLLNVE